MADRIKIDILAKEKEVESQGVHTATQSLIALMSTLGKEKYQTTIDKKYRKADIVIATAVYPKFYKKIKRSKGKKTIAMVHFLPDTLDGSIKLPAFAIKAFKKYVMKFYKSADELVTVNPYYIDKLVELGFDKKHVHSIPNFVPTNKFFPYTVSDKLKARKEFKIPESSFVVMGCGQTQPRKGIKDFLAVAEDNPGILFIWVGGFTFGKLTAEYKQIRKIIKNAPPNVRFTGIVKNEKMNIIYNCADVFFMPSYEELFPMTILEASNVNTSVLVRNLPLYDPILNDKVLRGESITDFSNKIKELRNDPMKRAEAGIKSSEIAELYTAQNVFERWDIFLSSLMEKKER